MARGITGRAPTESDVAKLAGVSQSAVSRAFTPGASVAAGTRQKIERAALALGYQPNLLARSLATSRSNIVGLAISNLDNPFYAQMVRELSSQLRETGRHILLFTAPQGGVPDPSLESILSYQIDGLMMTATVPTEVLAQHCHKAGVPIILINRETPIPRISTIRGQNQRAGELIAAFLLAGGHRSFGFVAGPETSGTSRIRQAAFAERLAKHGHKVQVGYGNYTFAGAAEAARELLGGARRPDAIFCASDYMAFAVLDVARREFGLSVPGHLSVVGFDDVPEAAHAAYDLTTFSQPAGVLAAEAIKVLDEMIENPSRRAQRREVAGQLIVRGSAKLPKSGIAATATGQTWTG